MSEAYDDVPPAMYVTEICADTGGRLGSLGQAPSTNRSGSAIRDDVRTDASVLRHTV